MSDKRLLPLPTNHSTSLTSGGVPQEDAVPCRREAFSPTRRRVLCYNKFVFAEGTLGPQAESEVE